MDFSEGTIMNVMAGTMISLAIPTFIALVWFKRAPYGRYFTEGKGYGWMMNGKVAWVLQEAPCLVAVGASLAYFGKTECIKSTPNMIMLSLFTLHYFHRWEYYRFDLMDQDLNLPSAHPRRQTNTVPCVLGSISILRV